MGLLIRRRQEPRWLRLYNALSWLWLSPIPLGIGAFYLATGNSGGRIIGGLLVGLGVVCVILSFRDARHARHMSEIDLED